MSQLPLNISTPLQDSKPCKRRSTKGKANRMIGFRSKKLFKKSFKASISGTNGGDSIRYYDDIQWEMRPGGMLVQKREYRGRGEEMITVRVSTGSHRHDTAIGATATFGELKIIVSVVTGLEPREQRLLFKGKEREDCDHLHMVGVRDMDKVLLLEDPAIKETKLRAMTGSQVAMSIPCHNIIQV